MENSNEQVNRQAPSGMYDPDKDCKMYSPDAIREMLESADPVIAAAVWTPANIDANYMFQEIEIDTL